MADESTKSTFERMGPLDSKVMIDLIFRIIVYRFIYNIGKTIYNAIKKRYWPPTDNTNADGEKETLLEVKEKWLLERMQSLENKSGDNDNVEDGADKAKFD